MDVALPASAFQCVKVDQLMMVEYTLKKFLQNSAGDNPCN